MNKKLLVVAVAGALALPMAANAASKVYGTVHVAVEQQDEEEMVVSGSGRKGSNIGIKGSMDTNLADLKAIYKFEAGMNIGEKGGLINERDSWAGLKSKSMGTVRVGTMATPYKASGKLADPMFSTTFEARSNVLQMASKLHGGLGAEAGRATQSIRYDSPSISGAKIAVQYMFDDDADNSMAAGLTWKNKMYAAAFDYVKLGKKDVTAMKISAQAKMSGATVGFAYEIDDDKDGAYSVSRNADNGNQATVSVTYAVGSTVPGITIGKNDENLGYALYVKQKLAKKMYAYVGYGDSGADGDGQSIYSGGLKYKF